MELIQSIRFNKRNQIVFIIFLIAVSAVILFAPAKTAVAEEDPIYKNGIFCYRIVSEEKKEVSLLGIESNEKLEELVIPGNATIKDTQYTVSSVNLISDYYDNKDYSVFYSNLITLKFDKDFTGTIYQSSSTFPNLTAMEFMGKTVPGDIMVGFSNTNMKSDVIFIVPEGMEGAYQKVIREGIDYYNGSDLYEMEFQLTPSITTSKAENKEHGSFSVNGLLYQVISSAKNDTGKVQLIGITDSQKYSYLSLPEQVENSGYTYNLTKLCRFSLVRSGATVIVVPDTVTKMDSYVFDKQVELLFLSKNCKIIPSGMITDENDDTNLRFVSVPTGVTTISANAFSDIVTNKASIILPTTIRTIGKKALYDFKLVTFLKKKPIANTSSAIKNATTVKVSKASISSYKTVLRSKIMVTAAKNIKKATKLSVNSTSVTMLTPAVKTLTGTLSKGSNEAIYWLSTDTDTFKISSKGVITPKKSGTAYAIVYTRTSGLHQAVKVTIK